MELTTEQERVLATLADRELKQEREQGLAAARELAVDAERKAFLARKAEIDTAFAETMAAGGTAATFRAKLDALSIERSK